MQKQSPRQQKRRRKQEQKAAREMPVESSRVLRRLLRLEPDQLRLDRQLQELHTQITRVAHNRIVEYLSQ